jgi:hypothetical protein
VLSEVHIPSSRFNLELKMFDSLATSTVSWSTASGCHKEECQPFSMLAESRGYEPAAQFVDEGAVVATGE